MNNWDLVQEIKAGASPQTCAMGGAKFPFDSRKYGAALQESGYPLIQQWVEQDWNARSQAECLRFLKASISRGSFPMLAIVGLALQSNAEINARIVDALSIPEFDRLKSLLKIGVAIGEWQGCLDDWKISDRAHTIKSTTARLYD